MILGKHLTLGACAFVSAAIVGAGAALDLAFRTRIVFTLTGTCAAVAYLAYTFQLLQPVFIGSSGRRRPPGCFALTFDDGPDPRSTAAVSELLAARGHHATFFVLGNAARRFPELVRQLAEDGHEVAVHGYDHRLLAFSLPDTVRSQIASTEAAVMAATGRPPTGLFRAPHGVRSLWLARTVAGVGYRLCGWDGRIFDTANHGADVVAKRVRAELQEGAVILLHDGDGSGQGSSRQQTVQALPEILDDAEARGLHSVWLSTLLPMELGSSSLARSRPRASAPDRRSPTR